MEWIAGIAQVVAALGIFNVWFLRLNRATDYRGGDATDMEEEFAVYGLPPWSVVVVGLAKLSFATMLMYGLWHDGAAVAGAVGLGLLMACAVAMHVRVQDPVSRAVPAAGLLLLCLLVLVGRLM